jgi:hypothetical protein
VEGRWPSGRGIGYWAFPGHRARHWMDNRIHSRSPRMRDGTATVGSRMRCRRTSGSGRGQSSIVHGYHIVTPPRETRWTTAKTKRNLRPRSTTNCRVRQISRRALYVFSPLSVPSPRRGDGGRRPDEGEEGASRTLTRPPAADDLTQTWERLPCQQAKHVPGTSPRLPRLLPQEPGAGVRRLMNRIR